MALEYYLIDSKVKGFLLDSITRSAGFSNLI